ncbi:hypothetical protein [Methylovirgula sp. 4M-Z18]|uniref:hypothetical protein n=1 Tax=Methylovirgula sp. 4M-Z18 TaxID=2293567 RepID=UPI000E2E8A66|nr:hypothetical protein [Methylovirgula sp. 4M-Z18]RFB81210.1 hypothetical protein DYH55_07150 [Methylovirgula sp. 4M-Z18]
MAETDVVLARVTAYALRNGPRLQAASCVLLIAHALLVPMVGPLSFALGLCAFAGGMWFAARGSFDADLFTLLASQEHTLASFDEAMRRLGLIRTIGPTRSMEDRSRGAIRLLQNLIVCVVAQTSILLFATIWAVFLHWRIR